MENQKSEIPKASLLLNLHSLPVVNDCSRSMLTHSDLCADFLDLRPVLFETHRKHFHPFLLLSDD